jgi:Type VI secretion system (T6SS), amidase effector protein 4
MRAIPYAVLAANFPRKKDVSGSALYESIGYPEYAHHAMWENTCAIRMSLALLGAGIAISPGRISIKVGKYKGRFIEPGQARLSAFLVRTIGQPEKYKGGTAARAGIGQRRGVISFYKLWGGTDSQGHIDLIAADEWGQILCSDDCYWSSVEVWFWPLK